MSNNISIEVSNLSKQYQIGALEQAQGLKEATSQMLHHVSGSALQILHGRSPFQSEPKHTFWALRDVSVNVMQGEVLGIIGRNGAGKSTLLKILTRITNPTEGYAKIRGRVGALLEVGTGFHPELTGRENIFLSGALLGMKRTEITQKFDEIVSFSGVERFIDTPVKRYSSGMYLRLAFAVSAHLEPDVLLVDEVLAVGDAEFQRRSLGKMEGVAEEGRTVLFVSHNMDAIRYLCHKALWLDGGQARLYGEANEVVDAYLSSVSVEASGHNVFPIIDEKYGLGFENCTVNLVANASDGLDLDVALRVFARQEWPRVGIGAAIFTDSGTKLLSWGALFGNHVFDMEAGTNHFTLQCPNIGQFLTSGDYIVNLWLEIPGIERMASVEGAGIFTIPRIDRLGNGRILNLRRHGPLILPLTIKQIVADTSL